MRIFSALVLILYIFGQFLSCSSPARNAYIKGLEHEQAGRYAEALKYFEKGLGYEENSPVLTFHKGRCLAKLERWAETKDTFEKFLELTKDNQDSWQEERWEAEFYVKKAKQMLGEIEGKEEEASKTEERFDHDEDYIGGINIVRR